ncbi:MAG TPA: hypothetical protein VG206_26775 [Terriglobia bacterium]|nr:hypothetical protein [Terriglobia bacterium]
MEKSFTTSTVHFLQEGRDNLRATLGVAFRAAVVHNVKRIVIFTAMGEGVRAALDEFTLRPEYENIKLIAVTFPTGKVFTDSASQSIKVEIPGTDEAHFQEKGVPIVRAHLPFDTIPSPHNDRGPLAQSLSLVGDALNMFGGSMSLCVQAVTLACDAGKVDLGEHVISLTSDTAILVQATCTRRMLQELVIREVLCKPAILTISRKETSEEILPGLETPPRAPAKRLAPATE